MLKRLLYKESDILDDIKSGGKMEDRAITYLIKKNEEKIMKFVKGRKGTIEDAEDVFQEGIAQLVINIRTNKFKEGSSIATYLYAICKNIWFKKFKKTTRIGEIESSIEERKSEKNNPEVKVINEEQKHLILSLFDHLKAKCKEVLYLWSLNYSMKEIADRLDYSSDQVAMNKKNLCLVELRKRLKSDQGFNKMAGELK